MPSSPSRWTLRTKLLASVLALFSLVMLATSALTVLETRRYLEAQLVEDLDAAARACRRVARSSASTRDGDGDAPAGGRGGPRRTRGRRRRPACSA